MTREGESSCKPSISVWQKIENTLQQLSSVVALMARQDEKLNAIERRVDRIEQASTVKHP